MCNVPAPHPNCEPSDLLPPPRTHARVGKFRQRARGTIFKNRLDRTELLWPELGRSRAPARGRRGKLGLDMKILLPYDDHKVTVLSRRTPVKYEFTHHW